MSRVELLPQPLEGEAEGTSSRLTGIKAELGEVQECAGTISGQVDGKEFSGKFAEVTETETPSAAEYSPRFLIFFLTRPNKEKQPAY